MATRGTNWSTPNTNIFSAILSLRKALNYYNAILIKEYNENCQYPIKIKTKNKDIDFRIYKHANSQMTTYNEILNSGTEKDKYLSLNHTIAFGTKEAVENYYNNGILSRDNFKSAGICHLVKVTDAIEFFKKNKTGNKEYLKSLNEQYLNPKTRNEKYFFNFFIYAHNEYDIKKFNRKLWVVQILSRDKNEKINKPFIVKFLNVILYPFKFIPKKSILRMDNYKLVTFRIGNVVNGFSIEFQIPKKFSL